MTTALDRIDQARAWLNTISFDFAVLSTDTIEIASPASLRGDTDRPGRVSIHAKNASAEAIDELIDALGGPTKWRLESYSSFATVTLKLRPLQPLAPSLTIFVTLEVGGALALRQQQAEVAADA